MDDDGGNTVGTDQLSKHAQSWPLKRRTRTLVFDEIILRDMIALVLGKPSAGFYLGGNRIPFALILGRDTGIDGCIFFWGLTRYCGVRYAKYLDRNFGIFQAA
jgi:hypothetical protein